MANEIVLIIFYFVILLYSIIIHEVAHGWVALRLGDLTAKYAGRLNLNPIKHIDLWGSIILPFLMVFTFGFAFGWAKPVPYNPYNLRDQKWGPAMVAFGGPGSNIIIAILAVILTKFTGVSTLLKEDILSNIWTYERGINILWSDLALNISQSLGSIFFTLLLIIILWNVILAFFNLIPIPPLDGSKILFTLFPVRTETQIMLEQYGFMILLFVIFFFFRPFGIMLNYMLSLFFGLVA